MKIKVNAFDWKTEFPEIMEQGGFDAVVGNPPWGADYTTSEQIYLRKFYQVARGSNIDSYAVFIERALAQLKQNGQLGYITPDTFLRKDDHLSTRKFLLENTRIIELIETGPVFSKVRDTWCLVSTIAKSKPDANSKIWHRKLSRYIISAEERLNRFGRNDWNSETQIPQHLWLQRPNMIVGYLTSETDQKLIAKMESHSRLGELSRNYCISRGEEGSKFNLKAHSDGKFFMVIPENVERYAISVGIRISGKSLTPTKVEAFYKHPKIWVVRIQKMRWKQRLVCGFDERRNSSAMKTLQVIVSPTDAHEDLKYLQAILASSLINFWCINYLADDMNQSYLEKLPIRIINFSDATDKANHDKMIVLVERMLELQKQIAKAKTPDDKTRIERQIEATDRQIDQLVYALYGLTEEEIAVVEGRAT